MNQLDTLYRALIAYRAQTGGEKDCAALTKSAAEASTENDRVEIVRNICEVDVTWVETIEEKLKFVENALREERQFIRSNGEVVPIEKVKHVSKDSVAHLAKHSNLITRMPEEGNDVVPDGIYTVEKLSDYAVYENRFLYMLLCYLRDFITLRYDKITETVNTYNGNLTLKKNIVMSRRKIAFDLTMTEEKKNDEWLREHNDAKDIIERIELCLKMVVRLLGFPLMQEVSKTPMIRPPITKTNVLKMNRNFIEAVRLYEYVASYPGDGYTIKREVKVIHPFSDEIAEEYAALAVLSSFLTYEHGLGLEKKLKDEYNAEEERRAHFDAMKRLEKVKSLKKRLEEKGEGYEEYILELEGSLRALEAESDRLEKARVELSAAREEKEKKEELIARQAQTIENLQKKYYDDIAALNEKQNKEIALLGEKHRGELAIVEKEKREIFEGREVFEREQRELLQKEYAEKERALNESTKKVLDDSQTQLDRHVESERLAKAEAEAAQKEMEDLKEERLLLVARLTAARTQAGTMEEEKDPTSEAAFEELENEMRAYKKYFNERWKSAKRAIRKDLLWTQKEEEDTTFISDAVKFVKEKAIFVWEKSKGFVLSVVGKAKGLVNKTTVLKKENQTEEAPVQNGGWDALPENPEEETTEGADPEKVNSEKEISDVAETKVASEEKGASTETTEREHTEHGEGEKDKTSPTE